MKPKKYELVKEMLGEFHADRYAWYVKKLKETGDVSYKRLAINLLEEAYAELRLCLMS